MKHRFSFIVTLWWLMLCLIAGVFLMVMSEKESHESETENRMLQGFPKLSVQNIFNDTFTAEFESFLSDNFFARDGIISFTGGMLDSFSVLSADDTFAAEIAQMEADLQGANLKVEGEADDAVTAFADIPGLTEVGDESIADEKDDSEEGGELLVADGAVPITAHNSFLWYEKTDGTLERQYTYDKDKIDIYADTLRIMQGYLPDDGVICFTQVPLASMANRWLDQTDVYSGWGSSVEIMLEESLQGTERIYVFSTYDILEPHMTGEKRLFYRSDHHWSAEGAYIVFAEMMKKQGLPVIPYEEYEYKAILSETASRGGNDSFNVLYPLLPTQSLVMTHRDQAEEIALMNYRSTTYRSFMNNTRLPWRKIVTGVNAGRKALVICDSFGNAFTPYLLAYYDEVHMCDFRNGSYSKSEVGGSIGEMLQYHGIDDVYIVTSTANGLRKDNSIVYLRQYLQ